MRIWLVVTLAVVMAMGVALTLDAEEAPSGDDAVEAADAGEQGPPRRGPRGKQQFKKMDLDEDGSISKAEWIAHHTTKFDEIDADADGIVTKEEMRAHHQSKRGGRGRGYGRGRGPRPGCAEGAK